MSERETATKIALVGTSRTGKTALLEEFRKRFRNDPSIAFVDEAARKFFKENPNITDRFAKEAQGKVQELQLKQEKDAHATGATFILCDRSVIDAVVCVKANGDAGGASELLNRVVFWLATYNKFLLLDPANIPYETDDVRQEDEATRIKFHEGYLEIFEDTGIPYELLTGTLEERIARVDEILSERGKS